MPNATMTVKMGDDEKINDLPNLLDSEKMCKKGQGRKLSMHRE
ncbi:hypothetical protein HM1_2704 [Heliomicrobium modesticaldum Ice1]|uniref:Uncharacterized protein n=1 Tax=Heliobacterium modesticaldum (strain ATCC 51547 / Ice1) TaxID=498761 RepID=B0TBW0_HELMI|nr:hypothetical protein HM1_2704 [Heliomicrobium modesticaldum Ice1]